jgi:hypothetical protein
VTAVIGRVAEIMDGIGVWWAVAGGWAIDLWLGTQTREHHDVEVVVRRDARLVVWDALHESSALSCIDPPGSGWRPWRRSDGVAAPAFQLNARGPAHDFDVFLESVAGGVWTFRRDDRVRRPLDEVATRRSGIPIVRPEVQLLYMAKSEEEKHERDFIAAAPTLDVHASRWLRNALATAHPVHRWITALERYEAIESGANTEFDV